MNRSPRARWLMAALVGGLVVNVVACSTEPIPPGAVRSEAGYPVTNRWSWSSEDGIDLMSRSAEVTRAVAEGALQSTVSGNRPDLSFIGYADAVRNASSNSFGLGRPSLDPHARRLDEEYGDSIRRSPPTTVFAHIATLKPSVDGATAELCMVSVPSTRAGTATARFGTIEMAHPPGRAGQSGIRDTGRQQLRNVGNVPEWNVFESWSVAQASILQRWTDSPVACDRWLSAWRADAHVVGDRVVVPGGVLSLPLRNQFPRWIGPAERE